MKKKNLDINFKTLIPQLKKLQKQLADHQLFIAVMAVLLAYVFMVWQINSLANAEPSPEQLSASTSANASPTIDNAAIKQVQSLEQNSPDVHALFEAARNNPFQE